MQTTIVVKLIFVALFIFAIINTGYYWLIMFGVSDDIAHIPEYIESNADALIKLLLLFGIWRTKKWAWKAANIYLVLSAIMLIPFGYTYYDHNGLNLYLSVVVGCYAYIVFYLNSKNIRDLFEVREDIYTWLNTVCNFMFAASIALLCVLSFGKTLSIIICFSLWLVLTLRPRSRPM